MSDFSVGDLVEARKGERIIRDRIYAGWTPIFTDGVYLGEPSMFAPSSVAAFRNRGFTLSLVEAATPPLPTEPGIYISRTGGVWIKSKDGCFTFSGDDLRFPISPDNHAPFTRLEPVPDTAKKVLAEVGAWAFGPCDDEEEIGELISRLERKFGVSDA